MMDMEIREYNEWDEYIGQRQALMGDHLSNFSTFKQRACCVSCISWWFECAPSLRRSRSRKNVARVETSVHVHGVQTNDVLPSYGEGCNQFVLYPTCIHISLAHDRSRV